MDPPTNTSFTSAAMPVVTSALVPLLERRRTHLRALSLPDPSNEAALGGFAVRDLEKNCKSVVYVPDSARFPLSSTAIAGPLGVTAEEHSPDAHPRLVDLDQVSSTHDEAAASPRWHR